MSQKTRYGILLMISAELLFACSWAMIKWLGGRLPVFEVVFFRATLSLVVLTAIMLWRGSSFRGKNYKLLIVRGALGFLGIATSFTAMIKMNLGNASMLLNTFPLFVALLAPFMIGERFKRVNFIFVAIAFAGIGLIMKPTHHIFHNVALLGLLSGVFAALSVITVRRLTVTDTSSVITFYFTLITAIAATPVAMGEFVMPTKLEWLLLVSMGSAVTIGQLLMTRAYSFARAATISPFAYVSVLGAYIFGIIIWGDVPDMLSVAGGVMIVAAGIGITLTEGRAEPEPLT